MGGSSPVWPPGPAFSWPGKREPFRIPTVPITEFRGTPWVVCRHRIPREACQDSETIHNTYYAQLGMAINQNRTWATDPATGEKAGPPDRRNHGAQDEAEARRRPFRDVVRDLDRHTPFRVLTDSGGISASARRRNRLRSRASPNRSRFPWPGGGGAHGARGAQGRSGRAGSTGRRNGSAGRWSAASATTYTCEREADGPVGSDLGGPLAASPPELNLPTTPGERASQPDASR